jgi:glutathione S-transferase
MPLTLYLHPLSSFCHKALIAFYENDIAFTPVVVDFSDKASGDAFKAVWPVGKFPVLKDRERVVPESTSIIEYLAQHYPGVTRLIPDDAGHALTVREWDRFHDLHVHVPVQKIITDRIRPAGKNDSFGVEQSRSLLETALAIAEKQIAGKTWLTGDDFTMADCAAAPALFYCNFAIAPLAGRYDKLAAYLERLKQRPSYARVLKEAEPFLSWVPQEQPATA